MTLIKQLRAIVATHSAAEIDGLLVDATTAHAVISVHDALNEKNRAKFAALELPIMVDMTWRLIEAQKDGAK